MWKPLLIAMVLAAAAASPGRPGLEGGPKRAAEAAAPRVKAFVCILPQAWFVERIGGDRVEVDALVTPGQSPHIYEPTPKQMARLAAAQVYFSIGFPFEERLLGKILATSPRLRVVDTRAGVKLRHFTKEEAAHEAEHSSAAREAEEGARPAAENGRLHHNDEYVFSVPPPRAGWHGHAALCVTVLLARQVTHGHADIGVAVPPGCSCATPNTYNDEGEAAGEPDPHFWLSPRNAKVLAANVAKGLQEADPAHAAEYEERLRSVQADLDRADAAIAKALEPLKGRPVLVYHPAFGYFAEAYGLRQVAVEIEGKEPSAKQLAALVDQARKAGSRIIFVQPQFSRKSAEAVARAIGGAVVPMDDLARDYLANLQDMAAKVRKALAEDSATSPLAPLRGGSPDPPRPEAPFRPLGAGSRGGSGDPPRKVALQS